MPDPAIIAVAITGSVPHKADNPAVPISTAVQIESTHEAYEAAASLVHVHVRNADETNSSDPEKFAAFQEGVRRHCPENIGQSSTRGRDRALEARRAMLHLRPEMASLAPRFVQLRPRSCGPDARPPRRTSCSDPRCRWADGAVRPFAEMDTAVVATRIGVELTDEAVFSLGQNMIFLTQPLPDPAIGAGYDHVSLDWMPHGHAPGDLFGALHFDVHFYMKTEAERLAIDPSDPHFMEKAANRPSAELMPPNFVPPRQLDPIPAMGEHWLDWTDPIFAGQPFEAVLIYGAWDGAVTFVEPMVTRELMLAQREFGGEVGQPARVAEAASFPNSWSVSFDVEAGVHRVSIEN